MADVMIHKCLQCTDNSNYGNTSRVGGFAAQPRQDLASRRAKWRAYSKARIRRKSFDGAVADVLQHASHFAKLGFFYKGYGKQIVCFQCGLELEVREGILDYHAEHGALAPQCPYVRQLNEGGQSDDSDSGATDISLNDAQMTNITRHTANDTFYGRHQPTMPVQHNVSHTYVYDSEDPIDISHDSISPGQNISVLHNQDISPGLDISVLHNQDISSDQDISVSLDHGTSRTPQYHSTWDDQLTCKVCLSEQVSVTFRPCGHLATCRACANRLHKCPVCRAFIREKINTFLS